MLTHQPGVHLFIQRNDTNGFVFEMDFTIDSWFSPGISYLVFGNANPFVVVLLIRRVGYPVFFIFYVQRSEVKDFKIQILMVKNNINH